jgi:NADH:ubiquinone oxidoreductase subunit F (NADH-binding)
VQTVSTIPTTSTASTASTARVEDRDLLGAWHASRSADLRNHVAWHGMLPIPPATDTGFPERFVTLLAESGLLGRGGAAFPTAAKLRNVRSSGRDAVLVVNVMEGEPASMKDRVLATCAPHLMIDGAQLAAIALGTRRIVVCVPVEREECTAALRAALGERPPSLSPVTVELVRPPGGYVAGEESALVSWLNKQGGLPSFRPDKSISLRLGRPNALVLNAETLAHMALIARHGPRWFRSRGDQDAPGTCLVTMSGAVEQPGVYEIALGTPLRSIVDMAMPGRPVVAALVGGYGGNWLAADQLETPYSPLALGALGASMGPGVIVALDGSVCGINETARIARYMAAESVGQCGPCVFGLPAIADDLALVAHGVMQGELMERLVGRLAVVEGRGACRHPDGTVRMVRSAISAFSQDLAAHMAGRPCTGQRTRSVLSFPPRRRAA